MKTTPKKSKSARVQIAELGLQTMKPKIYKLDDLLKEITTKNRHKEVDFGQPVGKETL